MPKRCFAKTASNRSIKDVDEYVVIEKGNDRYLETLAHVACEQKRAASGSGLDDWLRKLRWPNRSF